LLVYFVNVTSQLAGGSLQQTTIVHGVVCTKTVAHRKMQQHIHEPRILLLRSPLEYQRVENKFSSLEPQILQERDFLKNSVARIASMRPDLLLVEKTVSRLAQEYLLDANITLVANVKPVCCSAYI
jgi:1-phosphatidylinositol-3-phosphate 5-kinase